MPVQKLDLQAVSKRSIVSLMSTPHEMSASFLELIDAAAELAGTAVRRTITPSLSCVTISWERSTLPSDQWVDELESEIVAFGACNGLRVVFRRH